MENELAHTPRREWLAGSLVNVAPSYALHREAMREARVGPYAYVEGSRVRVRHQSPPVGEPALQRAAAALRVRLATWDDPGLTGPRSQPPVEELVEVPTSSLPGSGAGLAKKAIELGFEVSAWRTIAYLPPRGTFGDAVPTFVLRVLSRERSPEGRPLVGIAGLWINGSPATAKVRTATSVRTIGVGSIADELVTIAAAIARARARSRNSR